MKVIKQSKLNPEHKTVCFDLWNNEYPKKLTFKAFEDFDKYLKNLSEQTHYLLVDEEEKISGWAAVFIRENEKWFLIIISEKLHGKRLGTKILNELKKDESTLNGWVIDHNSDKKMSGKTYLSPLEFYLKNEFEIVNNIRLELEMISAVKIKWSKNKPLRN